ncbi:hypothetical protein EJ063_09200 [Vibrio aquaticus]|uniref:Porin n=1 Tax=Vibrio aquaticus TaxID=2496559 RepID=A0A3S0MKA1_9VIBR|nr:hypothetical protein EJ063_09200 [Vibrio aquaticus]
MQLDGQFNRHWSFTTQLLLDKSVSYDLDELTEFAFVRYSPNASWDFRVGRIGVNTYAAANSRHIDYAHLWVRPPQELYGSIVFNALDGIGATYYSNNPNFNWKASLEFGQNQERGETPLNSEAYSTDLEEVLSLSFEVDNHPWKWQLSYAYIGSLTVNHGDQIKAIQNGLSALATNPAISTFFPLISAEALSAQEAFTIDEEQIDYLQAAIIYFDGQWTMQAELFNIDAEKGSIPQGYGGYALLGHTFDSLTPYAIYGHFKSDTSPFKLTQDWSVAGSDAALLQQGVESGINSVRIDQETYSIGVRWDFSPSMAIKAQFDHVNIHPYGYGLWSSSLDHLDSTTKVQVFSLNMNFIF